MKTNPNDPAAPIQQEVDAIGNIIQHAYSGLTKRELFALEAMRAYAGTQAGLNSGPELVAKHAVKLADRLIIELS